MSLMDPATHRVRLNSRQCGTCLGNPEAGVVLRPGHIRELVRENTGDGRMGLICHATIDYSQGGEPDFGGDQALCRWFHDEFGHLVNGIRVMYRLGGFTEVDPPDREGTPVIAAKLLSERESAVLRTILSNMPHGSTGFDLVHGVRTILGSISPLDVSAPGVHRTAASLVRKNLAWRAGTSKLQSYKITQPGRDAVRGDMSGQWVVR